MPMYGGTLQDTWLHSVLAAWIFMRRAENADVVSPSTSFLDLIACELLSLALLMIFIAIKPIVSKRIHSFLLFVSYVHNRK